VPGFDLKDLGLIGLLPALAALAFATPERVWPALADRLAGLRLRLRGARAAAELDRIGAVVAAPQLGLSPAACWRAHLANNYLGWMQLLRCYHPCGWQAAIRLEGRAEIDVALSQGKGAILWVTQLAFSDLVTKRALHQAGYAVSHLSRDTHGFSETRFGRRWLNPIKTVVEGRYLAERLVMTDRDGIDPLRELTLRLEQNRLVSSTVAPTGRRTGRVRFLGGQIRIATGVLALAWRTGAPVLPVFTLRRPDGVFVTRIEPALVPDRRLERAAAIEAMLAAYGALLEVNVLCSPDQFPLAYLATDQDVEAQ
jgi:lauroyl/myristoyl acyltransferase